MSQVPPEVWAALSAAAPTGDVLRVRLALPEQSPRLLGALDARGGRQLLIELAEGEADLDDTRSRGLGAVTRELALADGQTHRYLSVFCQEATGHAMFDVVGFELTVLLARLSPAEAVTRVLAKWRRFWGQVPRDLLSREEQLGLFAETWFLLRWLVPAAGLSRAVERWRGPAGARHDFEWPGRSVEVKASTVTRGPVFRIHGLDQLMPPDQGDLWFFGLRMREEAGGAHSLPELLAQCRTALEPDAEALGRWESSLSRLGYSPLHDADYAQARYRLVAEELWPVTGYFPRLTSASLPRGVPAGVERVDYEINLTVVSTAMLCKPADATHILAEA